MSSLSEYVKANTMDLEPMSIKEFARRADIAFETARRLLNGQGQPDEATLEKVAAAFPRVSLRELREKAGRATDVPEPFEVPREFDQLSIDERRVLLAVGRQFLRSRIGDQAADVDAGDSPGVEAVPTIQGNGARMRVVSSAQPVDPPTNDH